MDKRYVRKCIEAGQYRTFVGSTFLISRDTKLILDDLVGSIKRLNTDLMRITPVEAGTAVAILEGVPAGFNVRCILVPSPQTEIDKADGVGIDEYAFRKLEERVRRLAMTSEAAIGAGTHLAQRAEQQRLFREDVHIAVAATTDEDIARSVAKRARGERVAIELATKNFTLGGAFDIPVQFSSKCNIALEDCSLLHWLSDTCAVVHSPSIAKEAEVDVLARNGTLKVCVLSDSAQQYLLRCLHLSGQRFSMQVNLVEKLSPKRTVCQVMHIADSREIQVAARDRIEARLECDESTSTFKAHVASELAKDGFIAA
jgi:hypothetical protein